MSPDDLRSYDDLIAEVRRLCAERRTGTLFIATADNESAHIAVRDGLVVAARFRRTTGIEAAHALRKITRARFSFTPDFIEASDAASSGVGILSALTRNDPAPHDRR
jgi:hypothetical protein